MLPRLEAPRLEYEPAERPLLMPEYELRDGDELRADPL